ncbi:MAG: transcription elongation factor GreA [Candidatus Spechtbacterales bacterium]
MEHLSQEGLKKIKQELDELRSKKRWEIAQWLREASQQGDLLENAEYLEAKEAQTALEGKIEELEQCLRNAKVVEDRQEGIADVGSIIELTDVAGKMKVTLVGSGEADMTQGLLSSSSPLGKSLIGRQAGEEVHIVTPRGKKKFKITHIS